MILNNYFLGDKLLTLGFNFLNEIVGKETFPDLGFFTDSLNKFTVLVVEMALFFFFGGEAKES